MFADGHIHRGGAMGYWSEMAGILLLSISLDHGGDQRGAGALAQQLQSAVCCEFVVEKVSLPLGVGPPGVEFIALGDENPTLFEGLHRGEEALAFIGVD